MKKEKAAILLDLDSTVQRFGLRELAYDTLAFIESNSYEKLSDEELATVKAALAHSLAQLNLKRRRKGS